MIVLDAPFSNAFLALSKAATLPEAECMRVLLAEVAGLEAKSAEITACATQYVQAVRTHPALGPFEAFQHEFSLNSTEGVMIMCLAEALLRIPDAATADALIHDKLSASDWGSHTGLEKPWAVNLSGYGLAIADTLIDRDRLGHSAGQFLGTLIARMGEPLVRAALKQAMKLMGNVFVIGDAMQQAQKNAAQWRAKGSLFSFDMLGEGARDAAQADAYFASYKEAIQAFAASSGSDLYSRDGISIKLSALHPRLELRQWERLQKEVVPKVLALAQEAARQNVLLTIDAEEATRFDVTLLIFERVLCDPSLAAYAGLGLAVQAYQKRALPFLDYLRDLAQKTGKRIAVRLVKGAYWDSEVKRAQESGLETYPVFTRKTHTDVSYLACATKLLAHPDAFYPQFATHNARTCASIIAMAGNAEFEFQRLHGMGEALYDTVLAGGARRCRIYAPVGKPASLLSYLIRRILENGANSSFVHGLYDAPLEELLADPVMLAKKSILQEALPLPGNLYEGRHNPRGYDLGNAYTLGMLSALLAKHAAQELPVIQEATQQQCHDAFTRAQVTQQAWANTSGEERSACLERIADLYVVHAGELIALCMREGGKTLADAIAELREAVDYCRYYALQARILLVPQVLRGVSGEHNVLSLHPRGVIVAISPWNFPLAIFTGQVVAALVTGNSVIAKPSEQTTQIAAHAVALMHAAGIPPHVLQLLCGSGETVGQALVQDARCAGVAFTGSTQAAWAINRALAQREGAIAPLIAETGGQNCMIVDSSALIEQTVDDIITSAFGSAGQRCSALRVAFVQEDIAEVLLELLAGAMQQLRVAMPSDRTTDIGPVIDAQAYDALEAHCAIMKRIAKWHAATPLAPLAPEQLLFAPQAFEIRHISELQAEVFGPVLHVIRYASSALNGVIDQINSTGYGLTFGMQSRIDEKVRYVCARVQAGNIYVNRSMTGALVGVQPFGGMGLSGTGPKAGGPHYLVRFCVERTLCVNTAAIGGNLELLTQTP
jgi:RHH-type proline utilization regulon transcriptional repressor/proline dehydrogenase/delta 1-pyrroline-5-carboxylate dehydrogenase